MFKKIFAVIAIASIAGCASQQQNEEPKLAIELTNASDERVLSIAPISIGGNDVESRVSTILDGRVVGSPQSEGNIFFRATNQGLHGRRLPMTFTLQDCKHAVVSTDVNRPQFCLEPADEPRVIQQAIDLNSMPANIALPYGLQAKIDRM